MRETNLFNNYGELAPSAGCFSAFV